MSRNENLLTNQKFYLYFALLTIVFAAFMLRYSLITNSLLVCANVDERTGLRLLYRLETQGLNPHFFHYPTLYYYATFFVSKLLGPFQDIVYNGRLINLFFGCILGLFAFFLSKQYHQSLFSGLMAATLTLFSPIIIKNNSYIITDILNTVLSISALLFFARYFEQKKFRFWFSGAVLTGLAISTKYNAFLLAIAYVFTEYLQEPLRQNEERISFRAGFLNWQPKGIIFSGLFLTVSVIFFALYFNFPKDYFFSLIRETGGINAALDSKDMQFILSLRTKLLILSALMLSISFLSYRYQDFFRRFYPIRIYLALLIMGIFFFLSSPFTLISWKSFVYDFGAELKANALSDGGQQWLIYIQHYIKWESMIVLGFFIIGLWSSIKKKVDVRILIIYLILNYLAIGSATRGFARYLTPLLPVVFVFAGWGISDTAEWFHRKKLIRRELFLLLIVIAITFELFPMVSRIISNPRGNDVMYSSYNFIVELQPEKIYYSGYIPDAELRLRGYTLEEVSWKTMFDLNQSFLDKLGPNDIILVEGRYPATIAKSYGQSIELVWSNAKGYGQFIYKKRQLLEGDKD